MKKHIITIAGDHASGQGMLTNNIQKELGYEVHRNGQYARKLAMDMGMSITEFQEYLNKNPEMDRQIEKSASDYAKSHDNLVIDAKLGWFAVPYSFKVYLKVDINVAAKRAFEDVNRKNSEPFKSIEEAKASLIDFDGTVFYFPDLANKRIYTKQINIDGTASLLMYELKEVPVEQPNYITREEFENTIQQIKELLSQPTI